MNRWAMCLTPAAAAAPSAGRAARTSAIRIAADRDGGTSGHLVEEVAEVARDVVEGPARRDHVDEPEQRGAELAIARREIHRPGIERPYRVARARGEGGGELLSDPLDLGLELSHGHRVGRHLPPGGVVLSISCHDIDAARRASSTAPPPRRPNSRFAYTR